MDRSEIERLLTIVAGAAVTNDSEAYTWVTEYFLAAFEKLKEENKTYVRKLSENR